MEPFGIVIVKSARFCSFFLLAGPRNIFHAFSLFIDFLHKNIRTHEGSRKESKKEKGKEKVETTKKKEDLDIQQRW